MFVILVLGIGNLNGKDLNVNAMAIALSYFFALKLSGDNTGGALNPTLGLVQNLFL
jgi:glycerol uptake facilitator-like aquaporin